MDDLVAAAFGEAAGGELEEIFTQIDTAVTPLSRMQLLISLLVSEDRDSISLLWLDAWHTGRRRPALSAEVSRQMLAWQNRVAQLIQDGVDAGAFDAEDPIASTVRILAVIDGLSIPAVMRSTVDFSIVRDMVISTAERELGLSAGELCVPDVPVG